MPSETGGMRNRSGGMSVSLASPDGRVVGGGVAGLLVAASPIQVWAVLNLCFNCNIILFRETCVRSFGRILVRQFKIRINRCLVACL